MEPASPTVASVTARLALVSLRRWRLSKRVRSTDLKLSNERRSASTRRFPSAVAAMLRAAGLFWRAAFTSGTE
jgi:hypothetical protein